MYSAFLKHLATVLEFFLCSGPNASECRRLRSGAREYAATSPLSQVTAAAFPPAGEYATRGLSHKRPRVYVLCLHHFV